MVPMVKDWELQGPSLVQGAAGTLHFEPGGVFSGCRVETPMFMDAGILLLVFAAGYGLRGWISARRRRANRKARGERASGGQRKCPQAGAGQ